MGIIDCLSQVVVDITFCPSENNKLEQNKFLIQVAMTDLKTHEVSLDLANLTPSGLPFGKVLGVNQRTTDQRLQTKSRT